MDVVVGGGDDTHPGDTFENEVGPWVWVWMEEMVLTLLTS